MTSRTGFLKPDGTFVELIDLKRYLSIELRADIVRFYQKHNWPLEPPDAWIWKFEDVCALYFRVHHSDIFPVLEILEAIGSAIENHLSEFA